MMLAEKPLAVDFTKEDPLAFVLPRPPLFSSKQAPSGIALEYHRQPAWETPEHYFAQHIICIYVGHRPIRSHRVLNGRSQSERFSNGDIIVAPATTHHQASWDREAEFLVISLEPAFLTRAAGGLVNVESLEIVPHFRTPDLLLQQIGLALKAELESNECGNRLYVESLLNALCVHLVRYYSASQPKISTYSSGRQQKLRRAIEYIHENLDRDLRLSEIASTVGMSEYHFTRLFKQLTGVPPHRYLVERRLEQAKRLLAETDLAIAEIAYSLGFANQSHFTTLFRKHTAVTPKAYRNAL